MLEKLEENILQFPAVEKEYDACRLEAESELEKYLLTEKDLQTAHAKEAGAHDESVQVSYAALASGLDRNLQEQEKRLTDAAQALLSAHERKKRSINVFRDAKEVARDFEEHGEISRNVLEHQSEIAGLLEHRQR